MKAGELKLRLSHTVMGLIDTYFSGSSISEKFVNSTLKIVLKQNIYKVDPLLDLFTDKNGEINAAEIVAEYANMIDENGFIFDLKQYIDNDMVKNMLPDKVLVIKRDDILGLLK